MIVKDGVQAHDTIGGKDHGGHDMRTATRTRTTGSVEAKAGEKAIPQPTEPLMESASSNDVETGRKCAHGTEGGPLVAPAAAMPSASPFLALADVALASAVQNLAEIARFGAQRIHHLRAAQAAMRACCSSAELRAAQDSYMRTMAKDYAHEWSRLLNYAMLLSLGQPVPLPPEGGTERHATPL